MTRIAKPEMDLWMGHLSLQMIESVIYTRYR